MYQINPQLVAVIHKEKIENLERQAEFARRAKIMRAYQASIAQPYSESWFAQAAQWVKAQLAPQAKASVPQTGAPKAAEEPC